MDCPRETFFKHATLRCYLFDRRIALAGQMISFGPFFFCTVIVAYPFLSVIQDLNVAFTLPFEVMFAGSISFVTSFKLNTVGLFARRRAFTSRVALYTSAPGQIVILLPALRRGSKRCRANRFSTELGVPWWS